MGSDTQQEKSAGSASLGAGFPEEIRNLQVLAVQELAAPPGPAQAPPAPGSQEQRFNLWPPELPQSCPRIRQRPQKLDQTWWRKLPRREEKHFLPKGLFCRALVSTPPNETEQNPGC